jgi:hypothetical protein
MPWIGGRGMEWIYLALVSNVMNLRVFLKSGEFLD